MQGMVKSLRSAAGNEPKHDCAEFKLTKPSTPFNVIPPSFVLSTPGYNANKQSHSFLCSYCSQTLKDKNENDTLDPSSNFPQTCNESH